MFQIHMSITSGTTIMDVIKADVETEALYFWRALEIYYRQPKSINKQVLFSENVFIAELKSQLSLNECHDFFNIFCSKLKENILRDFFKNLDSVGASIVEEDLKNVFSLSSGMFLIVRKLIPKLKAYDLEFFEFIFLDKCSSKVYIFTKSLSVNRSEKFEGVETENQDPFVILKFNLLQLVWHEKCLEVFYDRDLSDKGITWLKAIFVPKLKKLISSFETCKEKKEKQNNLQFVNKVNIVQYYRLYEEMKSKYAKYFIDNWTENTDPKKFVYEDIGIATYLMMLWNEGNIPEKDSKKQKFLDLGCGNGLLVHLLNSEGHLGVGIDMKRRKIWDTYPPTTVLKEDIIIPTSKVEYVDTDWLIGNHSDELTAWIPIMARLTSNHCQYFVLPCCPYQLNGMKFQRKNSNLSSYQDFISYVKDISQLCDFETYVDKLRIPSTKRICVVGLNKSEFVEEIYASVKEEIKRFIRQECQSLGHENSCINKSGSQKSEGKSTALNLKLREPIETARNCTKLSKELVNNLLKTIMYELLKEHVIITVEKDGEPYSWNRGRKLPIGELASCLNETLMKQLKNECKGLQTLLKNHHFLFEVSQGFVQFRSPESMLSLCKKLLGSKNETKWKLKKCWFFNNHPDKCPLSNDVCSYIHNEETTEI